MRRTVVVPLALLGLLTACTSGERSQADLRAYMKKVRARPAPPIEPLPQFEAYEPFAYAAANRRSPFEQPVEVKRVGPAGDPELEPDPNRPREYLEQFPIGELAMVGTLERDGRSWALIRDPEGSVHRVSAGDYMGRNNGRVDQIEAAQIELEEIVSNGAGGWLRRSRTVQLEGRQQG